MFVSGSLCFYCILYNESRNCPRPTGTPVPWTLPAPFGGWMMTGSWLGGVLQIELLVVSGVIYWPFIKMLDKQYISEENDAKENAE